MLESIIRLIDNIKKNNKKKKSKENTKNNSVNQGMEKFHTTEHIFIHGGWF